jgi:adenosylhomocysteine nucleosidase
MSLKVGIVSAMEREVSPLLKGWQRGVLKRESWVFDMWKSGNVTYVQSGIGREPGLMASRALVAAERPDILVTAGFAGALTRILSVGETITPGTVIDSHTGDKFGLHCGTGVLVSAPDIADEAAKRKLAEQYGAESVDMEGAAVARIAQENGIPVCAVKTISDELGFVMPPFNSYVREDGTLALDRFAAHVAVRPGLWPGLMRLARNSKRASVELSSALEHLLGKLSGDGAGADLKEAMREIGVSARVVN